MGNGIAICSGSARIHVKSQVLNVKMKCEVDTNTTPAILLRTRSEHLLDPSRWGYSVGFEIAEDGGAIQGKKEGLHPWYTPRIKTVKAKYKQGWNLVENHTYTTDKGVKIEGWLNGEKLYEMEDTGNWDEWHNVTPDEEADAKKYKYTREMMQKPIQVVDSHYIRFDEVTNAKIRNFTISPI